MVQFRFCVLLTALCACALGDITLPPIKTIPVSNSLSANTEKDTIPIESVKTMSTDVESNTSDTVTSEPLDHKPTTPTTTTQAPTTTSSTSTTSTTTPPPTTTTQRPTTTTPPPTTTTPHPTTTTPRPAPTPAPAPVPVPTPEQGTWSYSDVKTNVTCVVVQFAAQLNVTYTKMVENSTTLAYMVLNVPSNASVVSGTCAGAEQLITLGWPVEGSNVTNTMTLNYHKNDTTKSYALKSLSFELSPDVFVNASNKAVVVLTHGCDWQVPLATSYRCAAPTRMNLTAASGAVGALTLSKLQEEAFRTSSGNGFSAARECGSGDVPDAVPIAVGCALGGLVVVVLIAYLVGRRRSAARGYLSM